MRLVAIWLFVFYKLGTCSANALLELGCTSDAQCLKFEGGKCYDSHCVCTARGTKDRVDCKPKDEKLSNIIGGPCPCSQPHAECDETLQQCFCADGYMPSGGKRRCVPKKVPLNGTCEVPRQCQLTDTFAVCHMSQKRCICKEHFELHEGHCLALLDVSCNNKMSCDRIGDSICLPEVGKCACPVHRVPNHNLTACVPGVGYEGNCTNPAQCQLVLGAGSTCHNNRCVCRIKHYAKRDPKLNNTVCEPHVQYGAYCRRSEDCQQMNDGGDKVLNSRMQCDWGECRCRPEFGVVDNSFCVVLAAAPKQLNSFLPLPIFSIWLIYWRT